MLDLTFGEQVKIVLSRKGMTIKELAELIEERTGKKMSRQNLTQRLSRDNFQEQDMRMIASILDCPLRLSILDDSIGNEKVSYKKIEESEMEKQLEPETVIESEPVPDLFSGNERDITIGELVDIHEELDAIARGEGMKNQAEEAVVEEPVYTEEAAAEEAVYEEAVYEESVYVEPSYEENVYEEQAYAEPVYEESAYTEAEEPVYEEAGYGEPEYEEAVYEEPAYDESEYVESEYEEPAYEENVYGEAAEEPLYEEVQLEEEPEPTVEEILEEVAALEAEDREAKKKAEAQKEKPHGWKAYLQRRKKKEEPVPVAEPEVVVEEPVEEVAELQPEEQQEEAVYEEPTYEEAVYEASAYEEAEDEYTEAYEEPVYEEAEEEYAEAYEEPEYEDAEVTGDINPYTGREYESNSVRVHPKRIGYVQVYDRSDHQWTDMTEWAFLGYQERKKALLGKDYDPPIYLD